jgi:ACR3 family arsenite transporter
MALPGFLFIRRLLFDPFLPASPGLLHAAAPCTAMVFVWSNPSDGNPNFTLSLVALNDSIMIIAFAPIVALLLGLSAITVPWDTLFLSVILYIAVPLRRVPFGGPVAGAAGAVFVPGDGKHRHAGRGRRPYG